MTKSEFGPLKFLKTLKMVIIRRRQPKETAHGSHAERCRRDVVVRGLPTDGAGASVSSYA